MGRNARITAILDFFCRVWLTLFQAKFLGESIGSHEVKYFIPPWLSVTSEPSVGGEVIPKLNIMHFSTIWPQQHHIYV